MREKNGRKEVLVVEDDATYRSFWKRFLRDMKGLHLTVEAEPQEALEGLQHDKVDLMISDINFAKMNGYELAKKLAKKHPKARIILTTGYQTDLSRYDLAGLKCHLLHKPYKNLAQIGTLLERLLKGKNVFKDMDEDSFSENESYPEITEWTL